MSYNQAKGYEPLPADIERTRHSDSFNQSSKTNHYDKAAEDSRYERAMRRGIDDSKFGGDNAHGYLNPIYTPKSSLRNTYRERHSSDRLSDIESQNTVIDRNAATSSHNKEVLVPVEHTNQIRRLDENRRYGGRFPDYSPIGHGTQWRRPNGLGDHGIVKETYEEKFEEKYLTEEYPEEYAGTRPFPRT